MVVVVVMCVCVAHYFTGAYDVCCFCLYTYAQSTKQVHVTRALRVLRVCVCVKRARELERERESYGKEQQTKTRERLEQLRRLMC